MADFSWVPDELEGRFSYQGGRLVVSCEQCGATRQTPGRGAVLKDIESKGILRYRLCGTCGNYRGLKPVKSDVDSWPDGHKRCTICKKIKPFSDFHRHKAALYGYNTKCKACRLPETKRHWDEKPYRQKIYDRAKSRAEKLGREFTISLEDVVIPSECPVFGIKFVYEKDSPWAPSIDRVDSSRGYTPDNIQIISRRANYLKSNMTVEEAEIIYRFMADK